MQQVVWGGGEEAQVVLRRHQRHYHNIGNSFYKFYTSGSICHWYFTEAETELQPKQDEVDSSLISHFKD